MPKLLPLLLFVILFSCNHSNRGSGETRKMEVKTDPLTYQMGTLEASESEIYNKILGALVGSAIGDAMGAPSEMWNRYNRNVEFGYVDSLTTLTRPPSPEGTWAYMLPPGSTTDDTRWKLLTGEFIAQHIHSFYQPNGPDPHAFASHIINAYQTELDALKQTKGFKPQQYEDNMMRMAWLQEWAIVADAFQSGDIETYTYALHKFYGGELVCAGMLYAPALALAYPGHPEQAYRSAYRLSIFDQGYARDITALTAAMTAAAMDSIPDKQKIMGVFRHLDPNEYFRSRLFGRAAYNTYQDAIYIVDQAKGIQETQASDLDNLPGLDPLKATQMMAAYKSLDQRNQHSPAHAQEILLISLVAILYADFDFQEALEFLTNYGRDNDTTGAVVGAILGAFHGFDALPPKMKQQVIDTNRDKLSIDLEKLAKQLTQAIQREFS